MSGLYDTLSKLASWLLELTRAVPAPWNWVLIGLLVGINFFALGTSSFFGMDWLHLAGWMGKVASWTYCRVPCRMASF